MKIAWGENEGTSHPLIIVGDYEELKDLARDLSKAAESLQEVESNYYDEVAGFRRIVIRRKR